MCGGQRGGRRRRCRSGERRGERRGHSGRQGHGQLLLGCALGTGGRRLGGGIRHLGLGRQPLGTGHGQGIFDGVLDGLVDFAAVAKAHFNLGGVDVHIHPQRVNADVQRINGLLVAMQHVFIGGLGGVLDDFVAHKAAIHIAVLLVSAVAGRIGQPGAARDGDGAVVKNTVYGQAVIDKFLPQHIGQAPRQGLAGLGLGGHGPPLLDQFALVPDGKTDIRAGQGVAAHAFDAVGQLGGIGF